MTAFRGQQYVHLHIPNPKPVVVASECDLYGHPYEVRESEFVGMLDYSGRKIPRSPESVFCSRCGLSWKVER